MPKTKLKTVTRPQQNNRALLSGAVELPDFELDVEHIPVLVHGFRRMVRELSYDVCEMALTTYLCAREHGIAFTALPIFLVRDVHHDGIIYNTNSGLDGPRDLEGRNVAVNRGYTVTSGVWARTTLKKYQGVDLSKVNWVPSGDEHVADYVAPRNVSRHLLKNYGDEISSGRVVAGVGARIDHPSVAELLPNAFSNGLRALKVDRYYPINHLVVIRNHVLEQSPDVAIQIFEAFSKSKSHYVKNLKEGRGGETKRLDQVHKAALEVMSDPLPYGIEPNQSILEELIENLVEQKILQNRVSLEDIFAEPVRNLVG